MLIALLVLAAAFAALGPAGRWAPLPALARAGTVGLLLGIVLAVARLLLGDSALAWAWLRVRFDGVSGFALATILVALAPSMLTDTRRTGPLAGALILLVLADGVLAVLALALLLAVAGARRIPLLVWAVCAAASLALLGVLAGMPLLFAAAGLGALFVGGAESALAIAGWYVLARVGLAWAAPVPWGVAVLGFGLFGAVLGGVRACVAGTIGSAVPSFAAIACGLGSAALGAAMAARGADLLPVAAMGLEAALLGVLVQAVAVAALELAGAAVREAAGTDALAALGGLWRGMRATGLSAVIAGATLAGLPPAPGFTSLYLLLQALFGAHRIGGVGLQFTLACAVAATGAAAGLGALASMRLIGLAFLGRTRGREGADPRGDRRIADPRGDARIVMAVLAGVGVLLAVAPGLPLLLARGALTGADLPAGPAMLMPSLAALLLAAGCAVSWAVLRAAPGARRVPAWEGGASGGSDMAPYLPGLLASFRWRPRLRPPSLREWLAGAALVLLVVLIVLAAR